MDSSPVLAGFAGADLRSADIDHVIAVRLLEILQANRHSTAQYVEVVAGEERSKNEFRDQLSLFVHNHRNAFAVVPHAHLAFLLVDIDFDLYTHTHTHTHAH